MKINGQNREELHDALKVTINKIGWEKILAFKATVTPERLRWDLFWSTEEKWRNNWLERVYAAGCNDEHISTALKHSYSLIAQ